MTLDVRVGRRVQHAVRRSLELAGLVVWVEPLCMRALRLAVCATSTVMADVGQGQHVATLCASAEGRSLEDERRYTNHRVLYGNHARQCPNHGRQSRNNARRYPTRERVSRNHTRQYSNHERRCRNHRPLRARASSTDVHDGSLSLGDKRRCLLDARLHPIAASHSSNGERLRQCVQPRRRGSTTTSTHVGRRSGDSRRRGPSS
jgi:hypothetical protein